MQLLELKNQFVSVYHQNAQHVFFSPGRVNLIGEHTDYNGGYVFPCAISFGTYLLIAPNTKEELIFRSLNFPGETRISVRQDFVPLPNNNWVNYPLGCIAQFVKKGFSLSCGYDILIYGDVPAGAGLSSSAALEVVTAYAFNYLLNASLSTTDLALIGQTSEHEFAKVNCGIMDQFASAHGKKNHAIYLNCNTLQFQLVPIHLNNIKLIIANTHSPHKLDSGTYNERVSQCQQALDVLKQHKTDLQYLAQLSVQEFHEVEHLLTDPIIKKRVRHVVSENERTRKAVYALQQNNLTAFGELMNESHLSLQNDYEVTGLELDTLAHAAWETEGVIGSRMTGGGFGGCTVSLVKEMNIDNFIQQVGKKYKETTSLNAEFYIADIQDGAKILE